MATFPLLNRQHLAQGMIPGAMPRITPPAVYEERILQFGGGNFLRAFADWMVDILNEQGRFAGSVVVVQSTPGRKAADLNAQGGLYTVMLRGLVGGQPITARRIITCVSRALKAQEQWEELKIAVRQPALRFVFSNTTEAGIVYQATPPGRACPTSFPAKAAALLHERWHAWAGAPEKGLIFLPCELIEHNGAMLRTCILRHAQDWALDPAFAEWVSHHCHFLNTLVDRIVPGYPQAESAQLAATFGYEDRLLTMAENYHLWIIEGPVHLARELPLSEAGLNVIWTDHLAPWRKRKVRVLNGAHTGLALAAFLAGIDTVQDMMNDPLFSALARHLVEQEILPYLNLPAAESRAYAAAVFERFANPFIRHELLSIALNSVSKWKVRLLPCLEDYWAARGQLPPGLVFSLAALAWFYRGTDGIAPAEQTGTRDAGAYPIRDDTSVLHAMADAWRQPDLDQVTGALLADLRLWQRDLTAFPGLSASLAANLKSIRHRGIRATAAAAAGIEPR